MNIPPDTQPQKRHKVSIAVPLLLAAGYWVSLFLPCVGSNFTPPRSRTAGQMTGMEFPEMPGLLWTGDLQSALAFAAESNRLVFVEFASLLNTTCVINRRDILSRAEVLTALRQYVLVILYVDMIPAKMMNVVGSGGTGSEGGQVNYSLENDQFMTAAIPLYAILKPVGGGRFKKIGILTPGLMKDAGEFVTFLARTRS